MGTNLTDDQRGLIRKFMEFLNGVEDPTWAICEVGCYDHNDWGILSPLVLHSQVLPEFDKWFGEDDLKSTEVRV